MFLELLGATYFPSFGNIIFLPCAAVIGVESCNSVIPLRYYGKWVGVACWVDVI